MNNKSLNVLDTAEFYLSEMRAGRFEGATPADVYPNLLDSEIEAFPLGRDVALLVLGTNEEELRTFDFLFVLGSAGNDLERMRQALTENKPQEAYRHFDGVQGFVESGLFGMTVPEALNLLAIDESDYRQMIESFAFVRAALARKQKSAFNRAK